MISYLIEKIFPILVGFALAQFFNLIKWMNRPRLSIDYVSAHGLSFVTENQNGQDLHVNTFGFHLRNKHGRNAENIRVFIEKIESGSRDDKLSIVHSALAEVCELPANIIPKGAHIEVELGRWTSESHSIVPKIASIDEHYIDATFGENVYWYYVLATEREGGSFRGKLRFQPYP